MDNNKKTFKDFIHEDLNVFFNLDEFAEIHNLDGNDLPIIVIESKSDDLFTGYPQEQIYASQEVYKIYKTIYVKKEDYYEPEIGSVIELDGEQLYVKETGTDMGVITIVAYTHDG